jgi:hypothetical protein
MTTTSTTLKPLPEFDDTIFWRVIDRTNMDNSKGCWQIDTADPYPRVMIKDKKYRLNRLFLWWATDKVGTEACHTCHNPKCINPSHLYWGDKSSNMRDRAIAGNAWKQKLMPADVSIIKQKAREGVSMGELANLYNISKSQIWRILRGERWAYIM